MYITFLDLLDYLYYQEYHGTNHDVDGVFLVRGSK